MLGHRDSVVTRQVSAHELKTEERRRKRRALLEQRYGAALEPAMGSAMEATAVSRPQQTPEPAEMETFDLREGRDSGQ
jgi:hypothetical protein